MGSTSSKLKKYLQHGDEFAAMQLFQSSPELRRSLDPNSSYGESHNLNTALHYAAAHGMKHLLRTFLNDLGGNPNKRNATNETSLHAACGAVGGGGGSGSAGVTSQQRSSLWAHERRAACVVMLLQWRGPSTTAPQTSATSDGGGGDGSNNTPEREKINIDAVDKDGNSALHVAASCGVKKCVELLAAAGADLFLQNSDNQTPLDRAVSNQHHVIALLLESKMVFADPVSDSVNEADLAAVETGGDGGSVSSVSSEPEERYCGLRAQELQEAKDRLLVETADMLHVPLFVADALLRDNDWSKTTLLERWIASPLECCQLAGVQPPASVAASSDAAAAGSCSAPQADLLSPLDETLICPDSHQSGATVACDICCEEYAVGETRASTACRHRFCVSCWRLYLEERIRAGHSHHILCPAHQCSFLVPLELIETLVSRELTSKYLQFDIQAFVETNRSIQWCPVAGCGRAVRYPAPARAGSAVPASAAGAAGRRSPSQQGISHAVDCGAAHFFCWECLGEPHPPVSCDRWADWQRRVAELRPDQLSDTWAQTEQAANTLWLVANAKPCPNCRSPIQKHDGCNHMRCSKCKHDFCWMCLEAWKKHSSATGGYFRCNKLDVQLKVDGRHDLTMMEAKLRNTEMQELARFVGLYEKVCRHRERRQAEQPLLRSAAEKMKTLANSSTAAQKGIELEVLQFVELSLRELAQARLLLAGSYVFAYFHTPEPVPAPSSGAVSNSLPGATNCGSSYAVGTGASGSTNLGIGSGGSAGAGAAAAGMFEMLQSRLEEATECLAAMAARPYLKTPMPTIVAATHVLKRKRDEFQQALERGLVPGEHPHPDQLHAHRSAPPPWARHLGITLSGAAQLPASVVATLSEMERWSRADLTTNISTMYDWPETDWEDELDDEETLSALAARLLVQCRRQGCTRPRARHPRIGTTHDYCSLYCSRMDMLGDVVEPDDGTLAGDYNMELRIALEMSRLQHLEEMNKQRQQQTTGDGGSRDGEEVSDSTDQASSEPSSSQLAAAPAPAASGAGAVVTLPEPDTSSSSESAQYTGPCCVGFGASQPRHHWRRPRRRHLSPVHSEPASVDVSDTEPGGDAPLVGADDAQRSLSMGDLRSSSPEMLQVAQLPDSPDLATGSGSTPGVDTADREVRDILYRRRHHRQRRSAAPGGGVADESESSSSDPPPGQLQVVIQLPPVSPPGGGQQLQQESSAELESDTGIPRSPTLYISGVSINRSPEPAGGAGSVAAAAAAGAVSPRRSQSQSPGLAVTAGSLLPVRAAAAAACTAGGDAARLAAPRAGRCASLSLLQLSSTPAQQRAAAPQYQLRASRSASDAEKRHTVFQFPASPSEGRLSSVLHVQQSTLSSDDFHEALFLDRSARSRPRRSRKDRGRTKHKSN